MLTERDGSLEVPSSDPVVSSGRPAALVPPAFFMVGPDSYHAKSSLLPDFRFPVKRSRAC